MQIFTITDDLQIWCEWEKTRSGFRHTAVLRRDSEDVEHYKISYLNRTWEVYEFESILQQVADSDEIDETERALLKDKIANQFREDDPAMKHLNAVGMVAAMGNLMAGDDQGARNDWKERMLKAGLEGRGLDMPDDWDSLSEDEKERRLDGAIKQLV